MLDGGNGYNTLWEIYVFKGQNMTKFKNLSEKFAGMTPAMKAMLLFGVEGLLFQFVMSLSGVSGFGTNLYATNLGATDSQIGMIQLVANLTAVVLMLPAGIISDRLKNAKTVPVVLMLVMGVAYFFYGTVPALGENLRMAFFFVFLALTAGMLVVYNTIWQAFFGDVTPLKDRNRVYGFRNRFVFLISTIAPILCGTILTAQPDSPSKLMVLRVFFYICGAVCLFCSFVLSRIPGGERSPEMLQQVPKFSLSSFGEVFRDLAHSKKFLSYFICIMFFYLGWHIDWSMWYIGQMQYVGLTEAQLSYFNAGCAILQLLTLGLFVRANEKKGVEFTFLFCILSLVLCPVTMLVSGLTPQAIRPTVYLIMGAIVCVPQCASNLCLVQMLLDAIPEKNRSLIVSLNMAFVTFSNGLMPFLGVKLYTALGADYRAFMLFNSIAFVLRLTALTIFIIRYKKHKAERVLAA